MLLSADQKHIFAEWCKKQANDARLMSEKLEDTLPSAIGKEMAQRYRIKAAAFMVTAMDLEEPCDTFVVASSSRDNSECTTCRGTGKINGGLGPLVTCNMCNGSGIQC